MKLIITADWHIRATRPRCRIDEDWYAVQRNCINQVVDIAIKKKCSVAIVGDIFDRHSDTSFQCVNLVQSFAEKLGQNKLACYILAGNHDLLYHSSENIERSAIGVLFSSYNILPIQALDESGEKISAGNFDEEVKDRKYVFRHILCFPDMKSLPPNVNAMTAKDLLEETPKAEWIFTGDYHRHFHYKRNGRNVINPGCLMRQASDMIDYECGVYYVDTDEDIVEFIPIVDDAKFIDDSYILREKEREERIGDFVEKLRTTDCLSLDFFENVNNALQANELTEEARKMIEELLEV